MSSASLMQFVQEVMFTFHFCPPCVMCQYSFHFLMLFVETFICWVVLGTSSEWDCWVVLGISSEWDCYGPPPPHQSKKPTCSKLNISLTLVSQVRGASLLKSTNSFNLEIQVSVFQPISIGSFQDVSHPLCTWHLPCKMKVWGCGSALMCVKEH